MTVAEKLTAIAENEQRVYEAGMAKAEDSFWDDIQANGERTDYEYAFNYWTGESIRPKHKVIPTSRSIALFRKCPNLKKVESAFFDLSKCSALQTAGTNGHWNTFLECVSLEEIEDIGLPAGGYYATFRNCISLRTLAVLRVQEDTAFSNAFLYCYALENIAIEGTIGNSVSFGDSSKLSHESLMSMIGALKDHSGSGTTRTLTIGTQNQNKLTDAEKAMATQKGWTLA